MKFLWPDTLWLLLLVPLMLVVQRIVDHRRRRAGDTLAGLGRMHTRRVAESRWRRRLPPLLLMTAITAMLFSVARPTATLTLPSANEVVVLAMDVSGSMNADDIEPNRLASAQAAARSFVEALPGRTRVGIVSFASSASIMLPPSRDRVDIGNALERLQTQPGTAVGSAILMGLKALFPELEIDMRRSRPRLLEDGQEIAPETPGGAIAPGDAGDRDADWAAIVLLTDGQSNAGPDPVESARLAASLGVRVFPVGIGTAEGKVLQHEGWSMRVRLDEDTLRQIAEITGGQYYVADDAPDLRRVYDALSTRLALENREVEITGLVSAGALLLLLVSAGLSLRWFNRVV